MNANLPREERFRRYLFRELLPVEKDAFASELLASPELMDELRDYEYDLLDARVRGELPEADAHKLDLYLKETQQEYRLAAAKALLGKPAAKVIQFPWRATLALAAGLAITVVGLQFVGEQKTAPTIAQAPRQEVLLAPGVRDGEAQQVSAREVNFQLAMDPPIEEGTYTAKVLDAAGKEVFTHSARVKTTDIKFEMPLDARTLAPGSYQIQLYRGSELVNGYSFTR